MSESERVKWRGMLRSSTVPIAFGLVLAVLNHPTSAMYALLAAIYLEVVEGGATDDG